MPYIHQTETDLANGTYTVEAVCHSCGKRDAVTIEGAALFAFNNGELVQVAFPQLTASEREFFFKSGMCGKCWNEMFADEEEL